VLALKTAAQNADQADAEPSSWPMPRYAQRQARAQQAKGYPLLIEFCRGPVAALRGVGLLLQEPAGVDREAQVGGVLGGRGREGSVEAAGVVGPTHPSQALAISPTLPALKPVPKSYPKWLLFIGL